MGFFSFLEPLLEVAAPIIGGFLGVPAISGVTAPSPTMAAVERAVTMPGPAQLAKEQARLVGAQVGAQRRRTIVETFDVSTGVVTKRETFKGAPAVMQSDVAAANRLNRQLRRLNKKQPKKLVRPSAITQLKDEVIETALRRARDNGCPPACPT